MSPPTITLAILVVVIAAGIIYSLIYDTALNTSDVLLAQIPRHPYFAQKTNIFNVVFVKNAWGWTSVAFFALYLTSPPENAKIKRLGRWAASTFVWATFTLWFFGPSLFDRILVASGGECLAHVPDTYVSPGKPNYISIPDEFCRQRTSISPSTHPALFADPNLVLNTLSSTPTRDLSLRPRLYHGHDVSGHLFLLTLSILFLVDQLASSPPLLFQPSPPALSVSRPSTLHIRAVQATIALVVLWFWMTITTSVYFHSPGEKVSGFVLGVLGYAVTKVLVP
ncbi:hypothetical protein BS47DRAFT_1325700 [Hydnum rufescens UP504]|uniref:FIT family protein scs3 n=1 Tax=Hydnum rufescens UP504 TaxID=1448309 RepID=A0A9P6B8B5_9AGAM|nr:hypothetical protein BS47DRAFT_1325700 [Hydnum rufescens UP504]